VLDPLDPDVQTVKVILTWMPGTQPLIIFQSTGKVVKSILEVDGRFPTRSELRQWAIGHYARVEARGPSGDWERFRQDLAAVTADFGMSKGSCDNEDDCRSWVKDTYKNDGYAENCSKNVKFQPGDYYGEGCGSGPYGAGYAVNKVYAELPPPPEK
jgi:hypothetical protein